ncbi:MAG TPA: cation diffusion facilitator family transporter [Chthoniobacteraceae bacterium]|nr:cation diffusion facilitator family transporter [Chthoniobacteraceae bacterium]
MSKPISATRLALLGVAVNAVLAVIKITAGVLGHAYALIADGVESMLDIGGSLVIWSGLKLAAKPPDASHPYGHGKAEPLAAALVALGVLAAAAFLAVESVREILTPHHAPKPFTLVVLVGVIVIKETLFRLVINKAEGSTALETDAWHHRADAITSLAAFVGISIALIGGPGYETADDYAALVACAIIAFNGVRLLLPAVHEVMDSAPPRSIIQRIRHEAGEVPGVEEIDLCHVRKMGVDFYVDLHVKVNGDLSVREGHAIAHAVKDRLRHNNPAIRDALVHVEPI